jgi:DNA (cytosine-5)-methyltransferase 1
MTLTYVELFAGAGGLSHGLDRAGWHCLAHAEIEPHARAVLRYRWPDTPLYGDVSTLDGTHWRGVTLLSGGSPCQDLSVAGKRAGLKGSRSSLFHQQVRLWVECAAPLFLWENVVGALSSQAGKDFARVLSTLVGDPVAVPRDGKRRRVKWSKAGALSGRSGIRVAWRVLDLRGFNVPQRRRRVFVLAARPGAPDPAQVLLELEGDGGHRAPGGEARQADPGAAGVGAGSGDGGRVGAVGPHLTTGRDEVPTLRGFGHGWQGQQNDTHAVVTFDARGTVPVATVNTLAGDHANRVTDYTPLVQQAVAVNVSGGAARDAQGQAVAVIDKQHAHTSTDETPTLKTDLAHEMGPVVAQPIAFKVRGGVERDSAGKQAGKGYLGADGEAFTLGTAQDQFVSAPVEVPTLTMGAHPAAPGLNGQDALQFADAMLRAQGGPGAGPLPYHPRRLMPVECEALMSWPSGWTATGLDEQGREYALSDTARYRAIGNGVASVVACWIGLRIASALEVSHG